MRTALRKEAVNAAAPSRAAPARGTNVRPGTTSAPQRRGIGPGRPRAAGRAVVMTIVGLALIALLAVAVVALNLNGEGALDAEIAASADPASYRPAPALVERGAYLATVGNCAACHTARGGAAYAGGRAIETPFGSVMAGNLTPDAEHGLGRWTPAHFWRAMHHGRSKDGRLLYPAFPYPNLTQVTREDSDALYAYLRSLPPVAQPNRPHALRFPFGTQPALALWRAMFFEPGTYQPDPQRNADWNRGAYLVRGLAHCSACHAPRNVFGATSESLELSGGLIPMQHWYAPSLNAAREAGVADWAEADIVALLKVGRAREGQPQEASVLGPMAEVVFRSTQHWRDEDLRATATFLKALPTASPPEARPAPARGSLYLDGALVYEKHCVACHGAQGQGAEGAYPPLAGNRAVTMDSSANLVRVVLNGGFAPATAGNPRPYGMPPFSPVLSDDEVAAVLSYIRAAWGNDAPELTRLQVLNLRAGRDE